MGKFIIMKLFSFSFFTIPFQRPFTIGLKNMSYEIMDPETIACNITVKNEKFSGHFNVLKDIPRPFIDVQVLHDSGDGSFDLVYMNKTIDVCMFLNNRKSNVIIDIIYRMLSDYTELPQRCPVRRVKDNLFAI